jgi:hypothetical protein
MPHHQFAERALEALLRPAHQLPVGEVREFRTLGFILHFPPALLSPIDIYWAA